MDTPRTNKEARWGMDVSPSAEVVDADLAREMERLLRQVLPEWADEVTESNGNACCEISNRDVVMIRDFLSNSPAQPPEG